MRDRVSLLCFCLGLSVHAAGGGTTVVLLDTEGVPLCRFAEDIRNDNPQWPWMGDNLLSDDLLPGEYTDALESGFAERLEVCNDAAVWNVLEDARGWGEPVLGGISGPVKAGITFLVVVPLSALTSWLAAQYTVHLHRGANVRRRSHQDPIDPDGAFSSNELVEGALIIPIPDDGTLDIAGAFSSNKLIKGVHIPPSLRRRWRYADEGCGEGMSEKDIQKLEAGLDLVTDCEGRVLP